jgi:hypothetical protein
MTRWNFAFGFTKVIGCPQRTVRGAYMKKQILVEDRPPLEGEALVLLVLPLAIAVLAGVTVTMLIW